jgi:hypothetical protein
MVLGKTGVHSEVTALAQQIKSPPAARDLRLMLVMS